MTPTEANRQTATDQGHDRVDVMKAFEGLLLHIPKTKKAAAFTNAAIVETALKWAWAKEDRRAENGREVG